MRFNIDTAIKIGRHLQSQDIVNGIVSPEIVDTEKDTAKPWLQGEELEAHLLVMQDAGWLDAVDVFNAAGDWQARVTYQGHLWLEAAENEGILKRMRDAVARSGLIGANTVLAAVVKEVIANAV